MVPFTGPVPGGHGRQALAPEPIWYAPAPHATHTVPCVPDWYDPGRHAVQPVIPLPLWYVPPPQGQHTPPWVNSPVPHSEQLTALAPAT